GLSERRTATDGPQAPAAPDLTVLRDFGLDPSASGDGSQRFQPRPVNSTARGGQTGAARQAGPAGGGAVRPGPEHAARCSPATSPRSSNRTGVTSREEVRTGIPRAPRR